MNNMNDLISRAALLQEFETERHSKGLWHWTCIKAFIENAPAVDAEEVVRCEYCKHWGVHKVLGETDTIKCCGYGHYFVSKNGYCVYGERE